MNSPYLGTFTTHCFNLILGYILVNHQMSRMYATTWLERLFQSCQRKSNNESSKDEHLSEDQHRLLKTLRFFAWPIDNNTKKVEAPSSEQTNGSSTSSSSGEVNVSTDKGDWWC
ncbi:unnamed protein product, partial [Rotaria magnacalcarata]